MLYTSTFKIEKYSSIKLFIFLISNSSEIKAYFCADDWADGRSSPGTKINFENI